MEKFIPLEKLSKKKQRELHAKRRGSWQGINPVTRKIENPKAYNRKKAQKWKEDSTTVPFAFLMFALKFSLCRSVKILAPHNILQPPNEAQSANRCR